MIKNLLVTTALVAMSATAALAANKADRTVTVSQYMTAPMQGDHLASKLIGENVYGSNQPNAESIGQIDDLVIGNDGTVHSVLIGVGGFLGIGEKDVAVSFNGLEWAWNKDKTAEFLVFPATKESLDAAPAFDRTAMNSTAANPPAVASAPANNPPATRMATNMTGNEPAGVSPVDVSTISANNLTGTTVYSADNQNIGEVGDVLLGKDGKIDAVVLDIGGFLGIGEKPVAIAFKDLKIVSDANRNLYLNTPFTKAELDAAPTYDKNKYLNSPDSVLLHANG